MSWESIALSLLGKAAGLLLEDQVKAYIREADAPMQQEQRQERQYDDLPILHSDLWGKRCNQYETPQPRYLCSSAEEFECRNGKGDTVIKDCTAGCPIDNLGQHYSDKCKGQGRDS